MGCLSLECGQQNTHTVARSPPRTWFVSVKPLDISHRTVRGGLLCLSAVHCVYFSPRPRPGTSFPLSLLPYTLTLLQCQANRVQALHPISSVLSYFTCHGFLCRETDKD